MKDVTSKFETLREAIAEAFVAIPEEVQRLLREGRTEKGDALEVARVAGIMAAKRTWEMIPFCHPIPLTHAEIHYEFEPSGVRLQALVKSLAVTGVEMEAMMAASLCALTLYDMLKPHTNEIEIRALRLVAKKGGKSDFRVSLAPPLRTAIVVLSDSVAAGKKEDRAGKAVQQLLEEEKGNVQLEIYEVLPDDPSLLKEKVQGLIQKGIDLILTVGGTGLSPTDRTVEAIEPLLERPIPGIMEAARVYGGRRTPYAMLSRGIAGLIGKTLIITLPGSSRGARESCEALFPAVLHIFEVLRRIPHPHGYR